MIPVELIPRKQVERLNQVVDLAWRLFQSHFIHKRHPVPTEAPFQHHFASILSVVGSLYCVERKDTFLVDLETRREDDHGKKKFIDISCRFPDASFAIELKFKTNRQGAQDFGRIDAYVDLQALETVCASSDYAFGRIFMITDSRVYVNESKRGVGTMFCLHDGHRVTPGKELKYPMCKGREKVVVTLNKPNDFRCQKHNEWYFLEVRI